MYKMLTVALSATILTGCVANANYSEYLVAQQSIELARANAEAERYKAMAEIAKYGDTTTQVAAMMSMQAQGTIANQQKRTQINAPRSVGDEAREWAKILVNPLSQITINSQNVGAQQHISDNNARVSIANSDNNREVQISGYENETAQTQSTNGAFADMAAEIQAPAANYTDSNNSYADSYNADSYDQHTDSYNADSYNDQSDNSNNSDNSDNSDNTQYAPGA